jgi:hypothetical protein
VWETKFCSHVKTLYICSSFMTRTVHQMLLYIFVPCTVLRYASLTYITLNKAWRIICLLFICVILISFRWTFSVAVWWVQYITVSWQDVQLFSAFRTKRELCRDKYCLTGCICLVAEAVQENCCSWFQTFAVFWMLYYFFWVIPRRLSFKCRRFGTLCSIFTGE